MTVVISGTTGITNDGGYTGDGVVFADTTPANTLVTTTGGNVGIGTSSPNARLELSKTSGVTLRLNDLTTNYWDIENNSNLLFSRGGTEYARIDSSGNLLVGTTGNLIAGAKIRTTSVGACFEAEITNGVGGGANYWANRTASDGWVAAWYRGGSSAGSISLAGASTAYNTSSDYRLKENVQPLTGALQRVAQLRPVIWEWKQKFEGSSPTGEGFIAHEVQEICPAAVTGEKDAVNEDGSIKPQGIDTSFLVATLTAAIQEQQAIITALTARVAALEGTQP